MRNEHGVTLIEMILSIVLIGIIGAVAANAFLYSTESVLTANNVREGVQVDRLAMDRMVREMRNVAANTQVLTANANTFRYVDVDGNTISFTLAGTTLNRVSATTNPLATNVSGLTFSYLDKSNGNILTPSVAPLATDIWWVQIVLTVGTGPQAVTLQSRVHPRSF
jgi:prepilin-type N-terminal cleavage/methylation domain-containing protein